MAGEARNTVSSDDVHTVVQTGTLHGDIHVHAGPSGRAPPRQLPLPPRSCVGRAHELGQLGDASVVVVEGPGGIGKTTLALHWAHRNLDRYPDGQLYADLRGFDAARPVSPAAVLDGFLAALGVEAGAVPADPEAAAALYRSVLAGRRILVVLDNALDTHQVLPLLPGAPTCTVLITSRSHLSGLSIRGAGFVRLDMLNEPAARALLINQLPIDADPAAIDTLLTCCAGLPLALAIVAARAADHPDFPLSVLAVELHSESTSLDAFDAGDDLTNLHAVLSWSTNSLPEPQLLAFCLLGAAPTPDISLPAAASLFAVPPSEAAKLLRALETKNLIRQHKPHRFRMHDLVRRHAAELAAADPVEALQRLVSFYLHTARAADLLLYPHRESPSPPAAADGAAALTLPDDRAALAWFSEEHRALLAATQAAVHERWHEEVWHLAHALDTYQYRLGMLRDSITMSRLGLAAAEAVGSTRGQISSLRQVGRALSRAGQVREALSYLQRALQLVDESGDRAGQGHTHHDLQRVHALVGDHTLALHHAALAVAAYRAAEHPVGEGHALNAQGFLHAQLGEYDLAARYCNTALSLHFAHRNPSGQVATHDALGFIAHQTGRLDEALHHYSEAITLAHRLDNRFAEAGITEHLAEVYSAQGNHTLAQQAFHSAYTLYTHQHRPDDAARVRDRLTH